MSNQILASRGEESDNQRYHLIRVGDKIEFASSSLDREIGRYDTVEASFKVDDYRLAVEKLKNNESAAIGDGGFMRMEMRRKLDSDLISVTVHQYGGSFWFQEPLASLELKE